MAETDALIPYPHNQEIVLRHRDSVVVYNPASKQLVLRDAPRESNVDLRECPLCKRPIHETEGEGRPPNVRSHSAGPATADFASPEYFRMLHHSLPPSEQASRAPSPRRRLMQQLGSGDTGSADQGPPSGEFVGSSPAPTSPGISATAFSPNYFNRFFMEEKVLGKGGKGVVLLVKHVLDGVSLGHFALKRIPVGDDHKWLEKVLVEVQLLQHLSHQNLVSYRHVWLEDFKINKFGPSVPCAFVLQQYCNGGDLHNYVLQGMKVNTTMEQMKQRIRRRSQAGSEQPEGMRPRKLQFEEIRSFFRDITAGLNHLHANNYVHRDLKPSNCLLHDTGNELRVLVSDFGEVQSESQVRNSTGATGTISYCAPEVLRVDPSTGVLGNFTTKSDIFSLGMILYFLCFARLPYRNADVLNEDFEDIDLLKAEISDWAGLGSDRDIFSELPDKLYKFLRRLLALDPNDRPSAEDTLHGIRTGSTLDDPSDNRPRSGGQPFDTSRRLSRISPIDTPSGSSPSRPAPTGLSRAGRSDPPGLLQFSALQNRLEDEASLHNSASPSPSASHSYASSSERARSPSTSLILHSGRPSPTKPSDPPLLEPLERRLLSSPISSRNRYAHDLNLNRIKPVALLLKVVSLYMACHPVATKPVPGLVLLGLAALDLLVNMGMGGSVGLMVAHAAVLLGTKWRNELCLPRNGFGEGYGL